MKRRLTNSFIRSFKCPPNVRKVDVYDERFRGFLLEVRETGGKTFYQRYRDRHGKERQFKIGAADIIALADARARGRRITAEAILGDDPAEKRKHLRSVPTLKLFIQERYLPYVQNTKRSWATDETLLRIHILPKLGSIFLDEFSSPMIADLLHRMRKKGYASGTTNRVLVLLRFAFNLARKWEVPGAHGTNPTAGLRTQPDVHRQRFLTVVEATRLIEELNRDENQVAAKAIKVLLLTGARRNEITHCRWDDIDWQTNTLQVPLAKGGRSRKISLSAGAIAVLKSVVPQQGNPFVFPSPITGRPCASLFFPWSRVREKAGLKNVRLHDLRHSFASFLVNEGISLYIVQHLLGHSQPRMTQRYAHLASQTLTNAADVLGNLLTKVE